MKNILEVSNLTKTYKNHNAVNNLTFSVKKGEIVGLVGPNGAGKTTLMRTIMGLIPNYKGEVLINSSKSSHKRKERIIGCMIEAPSFYPNLNGFENLKYFAEISGGYDKVNVSQIIELLGLQKVIYKKVKNYSLGMKQRLGIAQALLNQPQFLILDEPTNGLDPNGVYEMRELIKTIVKENSISVLISSHILSEIEVICDRVLFIQKGSIVKEVDLRNQSNENATTLVIHSLEARKLVNSIYEDNQAEILEVGENTVTLNYPREQVENLIRFLVHKDVRFHSIFEEKISLEKQFFATLGGNEIE
ncbi:ABC transporter ATP-binding protein [Priestia megaterium]|uniref:ABC transporter ATP-binding protein n=1 Tax=Priestia megaterium TaxID=1404 RepID=UPI00077D7F54|nr:ABC transporter ATP-binding protein [Priestia megaterium]